MITKAETKNTKENTKWAVLSSCTGTQEPIQKSKQYATNNQGILNKENTQIIPMCTGTRRQNKMSVFLNVSFIVVKMFIKYILIKLTYTVRLFTSVTSPKVHTLTFLS